jgi:hypothetical protein
MTRANSRPWEAGRLFMLSVTDDLDHVADKWGDCWTWTGMDADSKLMISWRLGPRDLATAYDFIDDLKSRLATRVQLTTDGLKLYLGPVEAAFAGDVDYAMLVKIFGAPSGH